MNDTNVTAQPTALGLKQVVFLLSDMTRWRLLRELAGGESLPAYELARRLGKRPNAITRHLMALRELGVVAPAYSGQYYLTPAYRPAPGTTTIDFGKCVVRLDALDS